MVVRERGLRIKPEAEIFQCLLRKDDLVEPTLTFNKAKGLARVFLLFWWHEV